jgi:UPF0755 protein
MTEEIDIPLDDNVTSSVHIKFVLLLTVVALGVLLFLGAYVHHLSTPPTTEGGQTVSIDEGDSVPLITQKLEDAQIVRSSTLLYFVLVLFFDPTEIKASRYVFDTPLGVYQVAERLIVGDFDTDLTPVTIFEGESREKIANRLGTSIDWFDAELFIEITSDLEGQLFPDTYLLPEQYTTEKLVDLLHRAYLDVIGQYQSEIDKSPLSEKEMLTLASIVEREANTIESMKLVSGIFLNRLEIGMPLQADASIEYVLEHELGNLAPGVLAQQLREVDSPYNTYLYPGLPPTPIGNPGRDAIEAVLFPTRSNYFYYITGNDGNFYYAETYTGHLTNIDRHLK